MLPSFDGTSYTVLPPADLWTGELYVHLALQAVGESGLLFYVEGDSPGSYIALGFHSHQLKVCANFDKGTECAVHGEIVVGANGRLLGPFQ